MTANRNEEAIDLYEKILQEKPGQLWVEHNLKILYERIGKKIPETKTTAYQMKKTMEEMGYHPSVEQHGNFVFIGPTYYKKGEAPISELERRVCNEYKSAIDRINESTKSSEEKQKLSQEISSEIVERYHMKEEDLMYLLLKIEYNEVTPDSYIPPSE